MRSSRSPYPAGVRVLTRVLLFGALVSFAGCYQYVPAATHPEPGIMVRARLNPAGADTMTRRFGPGVEEITGTVLNRESDGVEVLVSEYVSARAGRQSVWNEAVRIPDTTIAELQERKLSLTRSALFGAAVIASGALAYVALDLGARIFDTEDETDPGPTGIRIPILSIPLRLGR